MPKAIRLVITTLALAFGGVIAAFGYAWTIEPSSSFVEEQENWFGRAAILYIVMILGMLARSLHESIQAGLKGWFQLFKQSLSSTSFATAIVVSPIVFFSIYNATKEQPDNIVSVLLSFQNGFFWKAILERGGADDKQANQT